MSNDNQVKQFISKPAKKQISTEKDFRCPVCNCENDVHMPWCAYDDGYQEMKNTKLGQVKPL